MAPFGAHANLQSIRSLNRNDPIDSDHSLDATEFLRRSFGPWTRTQTTRPFFKFSCSNRSTAPVHGAILRPVDGTDLFEDLALVRRWGRIGSVGRERIDLHPSRPVAQIELKKWLDRKRRRGYHLRD